MTAQILASLVASGPRRHPTSESRGEQPLTGNFRGDPDRLELRELPVGRPTEGAQLQTFRNGTVLQYGLRRQSKAPVPMSSA
jgi:hypothetical protein